MYKSVNYPALIENPAESLIHFQGVALGDAVLDLFSQTTSYAEYAYEHGLIPLGIKKLADKMFQQCYYKTKARRFKFKMSRGDFLKCGVSDLILEATGQINYQTTMNFDTSTTSTTSTPAPAAQSVEHRFFNSPEIQELLHVRGYNLPGVNFRPKNKDTDTVSSSSSSSVVDNNSNDLLMTMSLDLPSSSTSYSSSSSTLRQPRPSFPEDEDDDVDDIHNNNNNNNNGKKKKNKDKAKHINKADATPSFAPFTSIPFYYEPYQTWEVCNNKVNKHLYNDRPISSVLSLQYIMKYVKVLLYNNEGNLEFNFLGIQHILENNEWFEKLWSTAARSLWLNDKQQVAGEYFNLDFLSFLIIRNTNTHPHDLRDYSSSSSSTSTSFLQQSIFAKDSLDIIDRFIHDKVGVVMVCYLCL